MFWVPRWEREALNELTTIWVGSDSAQRREITAATHSVDESLRRDPWSASESRAKGRRVQCFPPLLVTFRIEADERTVSVLHLRLFGPRKN